jgi:hypothetical protein
MGKGMTLNKNYFDGGILEGFYSGVLQYICNLYKSRVSTVILATCKKGCQGCKILIPDEPNPILL